jgi:hypothetical protein
MVLIFLSISFLQVLILKLGGVETLFEINNYFRKHDGGRVDIYPSRSCSVG